MTTLNRIRPLRLPAVLALALILCVGTAVAARADDATDARLDKARQALNDSRYQEAARLYAEFREQSKQSAEVGDALYWEAFARYRLQQMTELKKAQKLLQLQAERYQDAATAEQGEALAVRIAGELAARGDAKGARDVYKVVKQGHENEEMRIAALHALLQMAPEKALPVLKDIATGKTEASDDLRQNAVFMLCQQGDEGLDAVLETLPKVTDPELKQVMIMCLAQDDSERSLDALVELMRSSQDPEVQQTIMMAIGRRDDERAYDLLAEIVADPQRDPELRAYALMGLAQSDDDRRIDLAIQIINGQDEPDDLMEMALMVLARSDDPRAGDALFTVAANPKMGDDVRAMALYSAADNGDVTVEKLRGIYDSTDSRDIKIQVCHVLTRLDDEKGALDLMLDIVRNEKDPEIRQNAIFWIGQFDDPRAADALVDIVGGK